ncbi:RraA family protein [Arthrobacter sp. PM3]|uniref:RraA family protein n=1 Tax=Arthrobacter sp. PM3 TaxID=2017685 RepID=UPI000E1019E5|nr:RraA family protein [Arthrobacter sp. PM3]AXJ10898.1 dimethylmenaquinone methyltransferase [Arthrobacter sp. PM3]
MTPAATETETLLERLRGVTVPTIGHFLEDGFLDPGIARLAGSGTVVGPARTVRIAGNDAIAMNQAILALEPGEILVVSMSGDHRHAPLGAVTAAAIVARGGLGVVVDGMVTDVADLRASRLAVHARGTTCLTTKRHYGSDSEQGAPVECGGVRVATGDLVLASDDGVASLTRDAAAGVVRPAQESDAAEPDLLRRIRAGEPLEGILVH